MAELAVGAIAAEEAVSTTIEATVAGGIAVAQPTIPLKCTLDQIATSEASETSDSLGRSHHTLNIIDGHAYIFGGMVSFHTLAGNEMHILNLSSSADGKPADNQYRCIPALAKRDNDPVPAPRAAHTASSVSGRLYVYGGHTDPHSESHADKSGTRVWEYNPVAQRWTCLDPANSDTASRHSHAAATWNDKIIIHGGQRAEEGPLSDTWLFDPQKVIWTEIMKLPSKRTEASRDIPTGTPIITVSESKLYVISGSNDLSNEVHVFDFGIQEKHKQRWTTIEFPINPLTPGPRPRTGAALFPIKTGMGRVYLVLVLGSKKAVLSPVDAAGTSEDDKPNLWSGIWALQIPPVQGTPAEVKDMVREQVRAPTYTGEWSEVVVTPSTQDKTEGKAHLGPRGYFGSDLWNSTKIIVWGGINPKGETTGDCWAIALEGPKPSNYLPTQYLPWNWGKPKE